jgi:hypothetical protein
MLFFAGANGWYRPQDNALIKIISSGSVTFDRLIGLIAFIVITFVTIDKYISIS